MQVSSHTPSSKEKNDHSGVCRRVILLSSLPDLLEHKDANVKIEKTFFFFFPLGFCTTPEASKSFHCFAQVILPLGEKDETIGSCWCKTDGNLSHKCLHISTLLQRDYSSPPALSFKCQK